MEKQSIRQRLCHAFAVERAASTSLDGSLEQLASAVVDRGLDTPMTILLEMVRPLNFLASQALFAAGPLAELLGKSNECRAIAARLEDRQTLGRLIERIEVLRGEREKAKGC